MYRDSIRIRLESKGAISALRKIGVPGGTSSLYFLDSIFIVFPYFLTIKQGARN
jgi:hypothetical protein